MKKISAVAGLCLGISACASGPSYVQTMQQYQGQTEAQLIDALGPPDNQYDVGKTRYLTYSKVSARSYGGNPSYGFGVGSVGRHGGLGSGVGVGTGIGFGRDYDERAYYMERCDVFFALVNHRVEKVGHRGNSC